MTHLADDVLGLIRTSSDLHRWSTSNRHGSQMHDGVDILEEAFGHEDPADVLDVTQRAIRSALRVVMRADDSSGIIGDACRRLIDLHPRVAAAAIPPPKRLVRWMIRFQFEEECDFFTLDPVAYAPALGEGGMTAYRAEVERKREELGPRPEASVWLGHDWFVIDEIERRIAVHDHDVEAIIRTHARDQKVPVWLTDTSKALLEAGEVELAIEWAGRATDHPGVGHQAAAAGEHWCSLLAEHHPDEELPARLEVLRRWPTSSHAAGVRTAAGPAWPDHEDEVMGTLAQRPWEAVGFALGQLGDPQRAWRLARELPLEGSHQDLWVRVADAYSRIDPVAVLPVYTAAVDELLGLADAKRYRQAAKLLARMRKLVAGSSEAGRVDDLVAELRETHRNRPRLQKEFTRAGLP